MGIRQAIRGGARTWVAPRLADSFHGGREERGDEQLDEGRSEAGHGAEFLTACTTE